MEHETSPASPHQLRAARAALGLSLVQASRLSCLSISTVSRLERGRKQEELSFACQQLVDAYKRRRVTFLTTREGVGILAPDNASLS